MDADHNNTNTLSQADADALDALLASRVAGPRLVDHESPQPPVDPAATQRVEKLMALIGSCPVEDPPSDLARLTMQRVISEQSIDYDIARAPTGTCAPALPIRLGEILAVAAMLLLGICLALPVLERTRSDAMRIACEANLGAAGRAFTHYATDFVGAMPRGLAHPGDEWYHVGQTTSESQPVKSNSANLYRLARARYIDPGAMACPDNEHAPAHMASDAFDWPNPQAVSYSYQNQFTERQQRLFRAPRMAILADRNPKFVYRNSEELLYLTVLPRNAASTAHRKRGQNVLFADGSVFWLVHPVIAGGDNIWLAQGIDEYRGTESPTTYADSFLVP